MKCSCHACPYHASILTVCGTDTILTACHASVPMHGKHRHRSVQWVLCQCQCQADVQYLNPYLCTCFFFILWSLCYNIDCRMLKMQLCILVVGALGGRFDHEVGNINVLYRFSNIRIILLSDDCLIYLLPKTHIHEIHIQSSVEGPHCGLIPAGAPSTSTTTTGLQWDLTDMGMSFGGLISTSNIVRGTKITVQSDSDLLWTISIRKMN